MQWFRWYHGTCADPKLGSVARKTGATRERVIAVWAMLLESASEADERGTFGVDADGIADVLNCDTASVQGIMDEMASRGMIGAGRVTAFERRNFASDNVSERVRKHRAKKAERSVNGDETPMKRFTNAGVTPPDTDTDTETEAERAKTTASAPAAAAQDAGAVVVEAPSRRLASVPAGPAVVRPGAAGSAPTAKPAKPAKDGPKYPHYPAEVCNRLYEVWLEKRGGYEYARFRKETAVLFTSTPPRYTLEELEGALRYCFTILEHYAIQHGRGYEWDRLTPAVWAGRVVGWVNHWRKSQGNAEYTLALLDAPANGRHARAG